MQSLSDAEFGKLFFAEIDLDQVAMAEVKPLVDKADYPAAFAAWQRAFLARVRKLPVPKWNANN